MTLKNYMLKNVFNVALSIFFSPPPTTSTFDVALEECVCVCNYFFHFVSCSVSLSYWLIVICLVTIVCLVNHACEMLNKTQKLVIVTYFF